LKPLVDREAANGALSYPSGHVTAVVALATARCCWCTDMRAGVSRLQWDAGRAGSTAAIASPSSRCAALPPDSFAGIALGAGVVLLVASVAAERTRRVTRCERAGCPHIFRGRVASLQSAPAQHHSIHDPDPAAATVLDQAQRVPASQQLEPWLCE